MEPDETVFKVVPLLLLLLCSTTTVDLGVSATWCVSRSDASELALQTALDYACGSGADCAPLQSTGLCYLPNTIQAHASYAFNSYYQRKGSAPGSCSFSGTSTVATTDPSYGSCVYPSSPSTAGGTIGQDTPPVGITLPGSGTTPTLSGPPPPPGTLAPLNGNGSVLNPNLGPTIPNSSRFNASIKTSLFLVTLLLVVSFVFETM